MWKSFLYSFFLMAGGPLFGGAFHAVMLLDTSAPDIAKGIHSNFDLWLQEFILIGQYTGLEIHVHPYFGKDLNDTLLAEIDKLQVGKDDVIFFYCSSHGLHEKGDESPWPTFVFEENGIFLEQGKITDLLKAKEARLLISMSDTCNSFVSSIPEFFIPASYQDPEEVRMLRENRYSALYLDEEGVLVISAASPGEFALYASSGGVFTRSFLRAFHFLADYGEIVTWDTAMGMTAELVGRTVIKQNLYYEWKN